jgi:glucose-1-phosphate adenylyltransferase
VRVHGRCTVEDTVVLPGAEIGEFSIVKHAIIDKHCKLPSGTRIGVDAEEDRRRFHVTEKGIVLVVPETLGQRIHHLR